MGGAVVAAAFGLAAVAGCSATLQAPPRPAATVTVTATAAPPATSHAPVPAPSTTPQASTAATTVPTAPPTPAPATAAPATAAPATAAPTLGQPAGVFTHGAGFGQVRPARIFNGGDPTGLVTGVTWTSWGGATASGTGTSDYVGPSQSVASGSEQPATVVAFDLGTCDGKLMYRAVEWYFPQHGQAFSATHYEDICTGTYVPAP
jgi:hypothetical protein